VSLINVALVVETRRIPREEIKEVAAAVQRQISRDFAPLWSVDATVDPFITLADVPPGYWPIIVRDDFPGMSIIGIHLDRKGQPFVLVRNNPTWSLIVSHEALEMISDPWGNRLTPGGSPRPGQGLVELLVEVCDPPGGVAHAYTVNGYLVSDFVTPSYYEPVAVASGRYSFTGAITRPRDIVGGGYLAWREPTTDEWWSWDWVNRPRPQFRRLGRLSDPTKPLRQQVDAFSINSELYTGAPPDHPQVRAARERLASSRAASRSDALLLNAQIVELTRDSRPPDESLSSRPNGPSPRGDLPRPSRGTRSRKSGR
jgi:hypothetical protein